MSNGGSKSKLVIAWAIAALNAVAAAALALHAAEVITLLLPVQMAAIATVAITAVLASAIAALQEYKGEKDAKVANKIAPHLRFALCAIADAGVPQCDVGIGVWTVKRQPPLIGPKRLRAFTRWPAIYAVGTSGIDWRPGKGIPGRCVDKRAPVSRDLAKDHEAYGAVDKAGWDDVPADVKQGLSFKEFHEATGRYKYVAAAPIVQSIRGRDETVGCVVLDIPIKKSEPTLSTEDLRKLEGDDTQGALALAARLVAGELP
jgi:hypothetical protein